MALAKRKPQELVGREKPRVAPPVPARSGVDDYVSVADGLGISLFPWQKVAARYITALGQGDRMLYREVAVIVARQNGKTELLVPLIVQRLRAGKKVMHTAQDRTLPREVFYRVAEVMWEHDRALFPMRNGRPTKPRYANGQEEIRLSNGGLYTIVAPTSGGARGPTRDLVIVDELREMDTWDFIAASKPTISLSQDPQMLYLSNAGEESSIVLKGIQLRADKDPRLAYLEWSAAPDRKADDRFGWVEANPTIGHETDEMGSLLATLEDEYRAALLEGTLATFEVEHLCRSVITTRARLVDDQAWMQGAAETVEAPSQPSIAMSMDPDGTRASVAVAWRQSDDTIALRLLFNVTGNPINTDELGADVRKMAAKLGVTAVGYDPQTAAALAKFVKKPKPEPISGQKFANATAQFVNIVNARRLRWQDADAVTDDLTWTTRKHDREAGTFEAVRADDGHPITASLAAIRAVWLAASPTLPRPKVM